VARIDAEAEVIMARRAQHEFPGIQPGDIGFDGGVGASGVLIRSGTGSSYGHCWVYHGQNPDGSWRTVEAGPRDGLVWRTRTGAPNKVVRLWRDEQERRDLLRASERLVGAGYGWGEVARIVCRLFGIKLRRRRDNPGRVICSNHVTQAALAARPELAHYLRFEIFEIWPGELAITFDAMQWDQAVSV
jgi:hypothetical protein